MTKAMSPYVSCVKLEEMLADGWKITPPVYVRPRGWRPSKSKGQSAYHLVLERKSEVHLVSIPEGPEIRQFLADSELPIEYV